ncbi:MAG: type II secretion system minor pseudopilin GspK [Halieaceae bacterium]|nr:type II secretion system minor pseudopilin GspK [Halieaceae bacterium]
MDTGRQRGAALIVAMLVFALATTLVVAMTSEFNLFVRRSANSFIGAQAQAYLRGGEDLARMVLTQDTEADAQRNVQRDDLSELWAQQVPPYALDEGGFLSGSLEDLSGRININVLNAEPPEGQQFTSTQAQFIRLLQCFEEPQVSEQDARLILQAVQDWLDADQEPRDFGAEDDYYFDREPSYRTGNNAMQSVSELRMVAYMTPEIFDAVAPFLTVWSTGAINIQTAPVEILRTINSPGNLQPLTPGEGQALLELRGETGYESVEAFLENPVLAGLEISGSLRGRLVERSDYFLYRGQVDIADRQATLYSVLRRDAAQVRTLVRASASL